MTLAEMKAAVMEEAELFAEPDCKPVISAELHGIVDRHQRASIHTVSTVYHYGDVVQLDAGTEDIPGPRNGHRYICVVPGTSAATAPTFGTRSGSGVNDGNDLVWQEIGPDYENVYDLRAILHDAWMLKAAKSSHLVSRSSGNSRTEYSNLQAQCRERAKDFAPVMMG